MHTVLGIINCEIIYACKTRGGFCDYWKVYFKRIVLFCFYKQMIKALFL